MDRLILFGLYSGQRLKDIATLRRSNFEFEPITFGSERTRPGDIKLSRLSRRSGQSPRPGLHCQGTEQIGSSPIAAEAVAKTGDVRRLSAAFSGILAAAGLAKPRSRATTGTGRSVRRATSELSFHCLRYTATSLMKSAGANSSVVQDLIGHDSAATSALYTRIDETSKRRAVELIPV